MKNIENEGTIVPPISSLLSHRKQQKVDLVFLLFFPFSDLNRWFWVLSVKQSSASFFSGRVGCEDPLLGASVAKPQRIRVFAVCDTLG